MKSIDRVRAAAEATGLSIEIVTMPDSTRTAEDAAAACGCTVDRIVKSMIFETKETGELALLLVSGRHNADLAHVQAQIGLTLKRADPNKVREITGFAIGGVSPIGVDEDIPVHMDIDLMTQETVFVAAGEVAVEIEVSPEALRRMTGAQSSPARPTSPSPIRMS